MENVKKEQCAMTVILDSTSRIPGNFVEYDEAIMTNLDHTIEKNVAEAIKGKEYYAQYSGWDFCGNVWWQNDKWLCEVWVYKSWKETFVCDTLEDIMKQVSSEYGYE